MNPFEAANAEAATLAARGPALVAARLDRRDPKQIRCGAAGGTCSGELGSVRFASGPPLPRGFFELPTGYARRNDGTYALTEHAAGSVARGRTQRTRRPERTRIEALWARLPAPWPLRPDVGSIVRCPRCGHPNRLEAELLVIPGSSR